MGSTSSVSGRLVRGTFFRAAELLVILGTTFWVTPMIVNHLGHRLYGVWTLLATFIGYYGLMDFGLSSAASRYISRALGKEDHAELESVASTAFTLFSALGLCAFVVTVVTALACPLFVADPADAALFRKIILLLGAVTAAGFPFRAYHGALIAYIRYDAVAYISIAKTAATNAAIYLLLPRGAGLGTLAVISAAASALNSAALVLIFRSRCPGVKVRWTLSDRAITRAMFDHGWKNFVCTVADIARFRIDSMLIAAFLGVSLVTPYAIGVRIVDGFSQLVMSAVGMMQPVFSQYEGRGDFDAIRVGLLRATKISAILSTCIGLSIIFYSKPLLLRWMGPGFDSSYFVAAILTAAFLVELPQSPGIQLLYGLSRHSYYAALNGVEAALNVVLSLALLKVYGIYGVALGTAIEILLIKLFVLPRAICACAGLSVREYLFEAILATSLKSAVPLVLFFLAVRGFLEPSYGILAACLAGQVALFAPCVYFFVLTSEERRYFVDVAWGAVAAA